MNTIKFSRIDEQRKETHNVEVYGTKKMQFNNKDYDVYSNVVLSIYVTNKCNAKCSFCINKYENNFLKCKELEDDNKYLERLDYILNYLKPLSPAVTITGGEATKSKRLTGILKLIKKHGYKIRGFSTNGSGLLDEVEGKIILQHMLENGFINNIDISRMSIDDNLNRQIMKMTDGLTNQEIKSIGRFCHINHMDLRLGCVLQKSGVKTLEDLLKYREFYEKIGIDNVIFREMVSIDSNSNNYNEYMQEFVDIKKIVMEMENNSEFEYIKTLEGMYYRVKVFKYRNMLVKCYEEKKNIREEVIRDLIFYANGNLVDTNWNDVSKTLLKYKGSDGNE